MGISGVNNSINSYSSYYSNSFVKNDSTASVNNKNGETVKSSISENHNIGNSELIYKSVSDYTDYIQNKYDYFNKSSMMEGIPMTVSVSSAYLKKCANDPEKAKVLEENLAAIPDGVKYLKNYVQAYGQGNPVVTYVSYTIDDDGNVTMASGSTNDPDGRIARENAEKATKEKKAAEKKAAEKRDAKKAEERKLREKIMKDKADASISIEEYPYQNSQSAENVFNAYKKISNYTKTTAIQTNYNDIG